MQAIETKYHGPGNVRGSRISATGPSGKRIFIDYPHGLTTEAGHRLAAETFRDKMKWKGRLIGGGTRKGYVFVFADSTI